MRTKRKTEQATEVLGELAAQQQHSIPAALRDEVKPEELAKPTETLDEIAAKVRQAHQAITKLHEASLQHARQCGDWLSMVKARMTYDKWIAWCNKECRIGESTANNYVRVFQRWDDLPKRDDMHYADALKALVRKRGTTTSKPKPKLEGWKKTVHERMEEHHIRGTLDNVLSFLRSYGVKDFSVNVQ